MALKFIKTSVPRDIEEMHVAQNGVARAVLFLYMATSEGLQLWWEYIVSRSCFGDGLWRYDKPWTDDIWRY